MYEPNLAELNPSPFKLLHTQNWKCSPLIFVSVTTLVYCGILLFFFFFFSFSVWHMFLVHVAHHMYAWIPSLVQTITLGKLFTHMTKSNFLMLKNITTSTDLVCSELTGNEYSKVTNLIWEENKLEKFWKQRLSKNGHATLSEILHSLQSAKKRPT